MSKSRFLLSLIASTIVLIVANPPDELRGQQCSGCIQCAPDKATAGDGEEILRLDEACATGECEDAIGCGGALIDDVELDRLAELVRQNKITAIIAFARIRPEAVSFAAKRNSIVVQGGCSDAVTAMFPLAHQYSTALALAAAFADIRPGVAASGVATEDEL